MEVLVFTGIILAAGAVCFIIKKHRYKKSIHGAAHNEIEQLNILLQNIEAYGKTDKYKGGDRR